MWRVHAWTAGAWAGVMRAKLVLAEVQALLPEAHPLAMAAHAFMVRADPLFACLRAVVGHRQAMCLRVHRLSMAVHTILMPVHTITIVLDRMYGHQHDVKSYEERMHAHVQALFIVFYRMYGRVDEVKNYGDRM